MNTIKIWRIYSKRQFDGLIFKDNFMKRCKVLFLILEFPKENCTQSLSSSNVNKIRKSLWLYFSFMICMVLSGILDYLRRLCSWGCWVEINFILICEAIFPKQFFFWVGSFLGSVLKYSQHNSWIERNLIVGEILLLNCCNFLDVVGKKKNPVD